MIFLLAITITGWYFFYLDLNMTWLLVGGAFSTAIWLFYRHAFLNFDGGDDNPVVALGMITGGFGMLFALISIVIMQLQ